MSADPPPNVVMVTSSSVTGCLRSCFASQSQAIKWPNSGGVSTLAPARTSTTTSHKTANPHARGDGAALGSGWQECIQPALRRCCAAGALIKAKYATPVNRWTDVQQRTSPTALLNDAVEGDLARNRVWREVMSRYGIRDVASTVFADRFGCWGFLDLWRDQTSGPFTPADAAFIDSLATSLTTALRECQARTFVEAAPAAPACGVHRQAARRLPR